MSNRTKRWTLGGVTTAFLIGAVAAAALALTWSSSASSARDATSVYDTHRHELRASQRRAEADVTVATEASADVRERLQAVATSLQAVIDSHNRVAAAHNAATDLFNAGRYAAAGDMFATDGEPAVAAEAAHTATAHEALTNLKAAITKLEEAIR